LNVLTTEEESIFEKNLVWIFADRRSGTTWLKELLSYKTKSMDEPLIGLHLGRSILAKDCFVRTFDQQKDRPDYFFSESFTDVWKFFLRKLILNRIYVQFNNLADKIVLKEPTGSMAADIIAECLPNSKIIILLRDGRDVVDSKIDESSSEGWELKLKKDKRRPITEKTKLQWIDRYSKNVDNYYGNFNENL